MFPYALSVWTDRRRHSGAVPRWPHIPERLPEQLPARVRSPWPTPGGKDVPTSLAQESGAENLDTRSANLVDLSLGGFDLWAGWSAVHVYWPDCDPCRLRPTSLAL